MAFANPEQNLLALELKPGEVVVDFGAGSGAYALEAAKKILPEGKVFAVDVQKGLLDKIKNDSLKLGLQNVEVVWGDVENAGGSGLDDRIADKAVVSNLLSQVKASYPMVLEVRRVLKDGGRAVVIDWTDSFGGVGPHADHVVNETSARQIFEQAGFKFVSNFSAGDHHYGLIFTLQK